MRTMERTTIWYANLASPFGDLSVVSNGVAITECALGWSPSPGVTVLKDEGVPVLEKASRRLRDYFNGERVDFEMLALAPRGTAFQQQVWKAMRCIPYGSTLTYGDLAARLGNPKGARAIGMACNRNPVMIIIPCHRVIGAGGKLTGYACGLDMKRDLLALEGR